MMRNGGVALKLEYSTGKGTRGWSSAGFGEYKFASFAGGI
jgi:hypothetical protein